MNVAQHILVSVIRVYRGLISPAKTFIFGPMSQCRFTPSCSAYALECMRRHGAGRGCWLALKRIGRCHPWGGCGDDPVPPVSTESIQAIAVPLSKAGSGRHLSYSGESSTHTCGCAH